MHPGRLTVGRRPWRLFLRRRPATDSPPAPDRFAYAYPAHRWESAEVYVLSDNQAAIVAERWTSPRDLDPPPLVIRVAGPRCVLCGEGWAPAVAYMPCQR